MLFKSLEKYAHSAVLKDVRLMEETLHWGGEDGDTPRWVIELAQEMKVPNAYDPSIVIAAKDYIISEQEELIRELRDKVDWLEDNYNV